MWIGFSFESSRGAAPAAMPPSAPGSRRYISRERRGIARIGGERLGEIFEPAGRRPTAPPSPATAPIFLARMSR